MPYKLKICRIREVDAKITIFIRSIELNVCLFSVVVVIVVVVDDDDDDVVFNDDIACDGKLGIRDGNRDGDIVRLDGDDSNVIVVFLDDGDESIFREGDGILDFLVLSSLLTSIISYVYIIYIIFILSLIIISISYLFIS